MRAPQAAANWRRELVRNDKGAIVPTAANALCILSRDPQLRETFAHDVFTHTDVITRAAPAVVSVLAPQPGDYPRPITQNDILLIQAYLQTFSGRFSFQMAERAVQAVTVATSYHPVLLWLAGLDWDGQPRIATWLTQAFGAEDNEYTRAVGSKFLIAAVRRVRDPGAQWDHMPVLSGAQGIGKSRACRTLFSDRWFTDDLPHDFANKDSQQALMGVWGVEMSEIGQLLGRRNASETIKAFLSRRVDRFRPPYGRGFINAARQIVFVGTTNRDDYLQDDTGNRRIWPVACTKADWQWVAENREQLWAEAADAEAHGTAIWLEDVKIIEEAHEQQEQRRPTDTWMRPLEKYLAGKRRVEMIDVLAGGMGILDRDQERQHEMRAGAIMRYLGWKSGVKWDPNAKKSRRCWANLNQEGEQAEAPDHDDHNDLEC